MVCIRARLLVGQLRSLTCKYKFQNIQSVDMIYYDHDAFIRVHLGSKPLPPSVLAVSYSLVGSSRQETEVLLVEALDKFEHALESWTEGRPQSTPRGSRAPKKCPTWIGKL